MYIVHTTKLTYCYCVEYIIKAIDFWPPRFRQPTCLKFIIPTETSWHGITQTRSSILELHDEYFQTSTQNHTFKHYTNLSWPFLHENHASQQNSGRNNEQERTFCHKSASHRKPSKKGTELYHILITFCTLRWFPVHKLCSHRVTLSLGYMNCVSTSVKYSDFVVCG